MKPTSAFDDFGDAVDLDDFFLEGDAARAYLLLAWHSALELQSCFTRGVSEGFHPPVVQVAAAVEHHGADALVFGAFGNRLTDRTGAICFGAAQVRPRVGFVRARRGQRPARGVVDHLGVNVVQASEDVEPRPGPCAAERHANASVAACACRAGIQWLKHGYFFFAPALPALRRMTSSAYLIPLPLYGSGGRTRLIFAAVSPTSSLSAPLTVMALATTAKLIPAGAGTSTGCE